MFAKSYKITEPKRFEIFVEDIRNDHVLVRPEYLAVCKADIRYYLGNRSLRILKRKFPMSLIHEATGVVVRDKSGKFKSGQRIVLLPCRKSDCDGTKCEVCVRNNPRLLDNYCPESKFCSSNYDGFSKELKSVTVWGDGIMGYIISLVAKYGFGCEVNIVGLNKEKLDMFDFANVYYSNDIDALPRMSVAIEAVGGNASGIAANQAIDKLYSGGKLILSGVANENVPLNTRMVLEHGISIRGTTRSVRCDFEKAVELLTIPEFREHILRLMLSVNDVTNIRDYYAIFEKESKSTALGKNIMKISF